MTELITLEKVDVTQQEQQILSQVSFSVHPRKITTVIGPNGAGKSTLIKVVLGLLHPTSGRVIRQPNLAVGYVPQKLNLNETLPLQVSRFLELVPNTKTLIQQMLKRTHADHLYHQNMHALSGGELQRVLLARALLNKPDLLVLDEPAQGVDIHGQAQLYALIHTLTEEMQCAVLMVSHDLHLVMARTDQVICLNRHICCQGKPHNVAEHPEFARLFGQSERHQLAVYTHHHDRYNEDSDHGG